MSSFNILSVRLPADVCGENASFKQAACYKTYEAFNSMFEVRLNAPLHVEWEITNACNLRCRHCYASAGDKASGELTTKEALDLVAELDSTGAADVTLSGGEPFLRKDLWQILRALNSRGIPFIIYTNGTLLDHRRVKKLSQTGVSFISVSLNGATPRTHNFVQNANTFQKVLRTIELLREAKIKVQILFTLMKINAHETQDLIGLATRLGVDDICIYPFYPVGRGSRHLKDLELPHQAAKTVLAQSLKKNKEGPPHLFVGGCSRQLFHSSERQSLIRGAPCAKLTAVVTSDGHLRPCNFLSYRTKYGIRQRKLADLWSEQLFKRIRDWNKWVHPTCSKCKRLSMCHGSCLSLHLDKLEKAFKSELEALSG